MKWRGWSPAGHDSDTASEIRKTELDALLAHVAVLDGRLRQLAAKWRSQARHPQRHDKPAEQLLLHKHADELLGELDDKDDV